MQSGLSSALRPVYMKLLLVGGGVLLIGLFSPLYNLSETVDGGLYSMSAFGGSLVDKLGDDVFNPWVAVVSFGFALVCVVLPFVCARLKLSERAIRQYVAVVGSLAGVCGVLSLVFFHFWFDLTFPEGSFFLSDLEVNRGLGFGYFLVWVGVALVFSSAYVSRGLASEVKK